MTAKVTLYTKDYCPHCKAAKALLKSKGIIFENYEVSTDPLLRAEMNGPANLHRGVPCGRKQ